MQHPLIVDVARQQRRLQNCGPRSQQQAESQQLQTTNVAVTSIMEELQRPGWTFQVSPLELTFEVHHRS